MNKNVQIISKFILVIAFLNLFAFSVRHVNLGGKSLGIFTNILREFSEFPALVIDVFREVNMSSRLVNVDHDFKPLNKMKYNVYAMNSYFDKSKWNISLTNLRNDSIIYKWYLTENNFLKTTDEIFSHAIPVQPILLVDKSLIVSNSHTFNLYRLDSLSNIVWHNTDYLFHHSLNLDNEGNVWVCTREIIELSEDKKIYYLDDYITKIDVENGNTLYNKSVREILTDNELGYLVYGIGNQIGAATKLLDPLHLNEIEPVLSDGPYWKTGDLFLSLRHRSMILLYRPSTNRILRVITGPFFNQHDVDIQSDSVITFFNNNVPYHMSNDSLYKKITKLDSESDLTFNQISQVLKYNFNDSTFTTMYLDQFIENKIFTKTDGLHHILSNSDIYVESQNEGKIYILNEKEVLLRKYLNPIINNKVERPNWVRIYENINF